MKCYMDHLYVFEHPTHIFNDAGGRQLIVTGVEIRSHINDEGDVEYIWYLTTKEKQWMVPTRTRSCQIAGTLLREYCRWIAMNAPMKRIQKLAREMLSEISFQQARIEEELEGIL